MVDKGGISNYLCSRVNEPYSPIWDVVRFCDNLSVLSDSTDYCFVSGLTSKLLPPPLVVDNGAVLLLHRGGKGEGSKHQMLIVIT
jgi:hypothetical protein